LLAVDGPAGTPLSRAPEVLASIAQALQEPAGFPPLQRGANGCSSPIPWRSTITRAPASSGPGSGPSSRGHGPATPQTPDAIAAFQARGQEPRQGVMPPEHTRPVRVCSQDASRFGWLSRRRRRLTAGGLPPLGLRQHVCAWCSVYGAVAPTTGARFFLQRPSLHAATFQLWLDAFGQAFPDSLNLWLLDNSGAHTTQGMRWPAHVRGVWLPPDGPELNPSERVWRDLKDPLAWQQFADVEAQQDAVSAL
jgi:DDE superfamily endonuclease